MNYKLCSRCKFRVPATFKSCHVCGNDSWLTYRDRTQSSISVGSKDANLLAKFKRIVTDISWDRTDIARPRNENPAAEPAGLKPIESTIPTNNYVGNRLQDAELAPVKRQELWIDKSEKEVSQLKQEIEELSTWFRNYGSEGLLTNRG